jgi:putative ABC transport system permease protein
MSQNSGGRRCERNQRDSSQFQFLMSEFHTLDTGERLQNPFSSSTIRTVYTRCSTLHPILDTGVHCPRLWGPRMSLMHFVRRNTFRNKRRSILTVLSIGFGLLLLTVMMTIWRAFYIDQGSVESSHRLLVRHKVSFAFFLPTFYREKIRTLPGVKHVVNETWFGGQYKDDRPEHFFAQFGTDPQEIMEVNRDLRMPEDQLRAWQHDRAGCIVDGELAKRLGWKLGDRVYIKGTIFPVNLDLTVRGIFTASTPTETLYFDNDYLAEGYPHVKGFVGFYAVLADSPEAVPRLTEEIDSAFRNSTRPTKTGSEKSFQLDWIAMMGNVRAFLLSISGAVVFATLLVSANTMAMSIRERTREVALLKALGFTRGTVLGLFVSEAMILSLTGGLVGVLGAWGVLTAMAHSPKGTLFMNGIGITLPTVLVALTIAAALGLLSSIVPAYNASRRKIVDGLRYVG